MTDNNATATTAATATAAAPAPLNEFVTMQATPFHFKTDKDTVVKDDDGTVLETIKGKKHPTVNVHLPIPKPSRLVEFLTDTTEKFAKEREVLMAAVTGVVFSVARGQINEFRDNNKDAVVTPGSLNYDLLDFTAIANMPKSERGSYVPPEEDVKAFLASYLAVMPEATNKPVERIKNHIDIIATGFKKQRANKTMLEFFKDAFAVYITSAPEEEVEDHAEVIEYYQTRLNRWLATEDKISMDDL